MSDSIHYGNIHAHTLNIKLNKKHYKYVTKTNYILKLKPKKEDTKISSAM